MGGFKFSLVGVVVNFDANAAEILTAVGTIAAVLVSLGIVIAPRFCQPRLELITGAETPWLRVSKAIRGYEIRIAVRNPSRWPATNVTVRCELFEAHQPGQVPVMHKPDLVSGIYLEWYEGGDRLSAAGVDLARGGARYACLFVIGMGLTTREGADPGATVIGSSVGSRGPWREGIAFSGVVVASADNCKPVRARVVVSGVPEGRLGTSGDPAEDLPNLSVVFAPSDSADDPLVDAGRTRRAVWSNSRRRRHNPVDSPASDKWTP